MGERTSRSGPSPGPDPPEYRPDGGGRREEAGHYQRRSAVVQGRRPKPRRAAMGDAKAQTQVPTPADKNARTSKKRREQRPNPAAELTWPGPRAGGEAVDAKHAGRGQQGALVTTSRR